MIEGPNIKNNPLRISVFLLVVSYFLGEFFLPKYPLIYMLNLLGILGFMISLFLFFSSINLFQSYEENPNPATSTKRLIKTGIYAYTRNPIYLSFVLFLFSMFMIFENVMYFISALGLAYWIHNYVIKFEEQYLIKELSEEYKSYMNSVSRWFFF